MGKNTAAIKAYIQNQLKGDVEYDQMSLVAVARPLAVTIKRVNEIVRGWINYFRIGMMKLFMEELGEWLRHKIRVIIMKQWKRPKSIYRNLSYLNRKYKIGCNQEEIYKVANSRLG